MKSLNIPYVTRRMIGNYALELEGMKVYFLSSDSIGAKSSSIFIKTADTTILIDPGVAAMQPGYPLNDRDKVKIAEYSRRTILKYAKKAKIVVVTHYHYDHFMDPTSAPELYLGKKLFIKNPNIFINKSQWFRARKFFKELLEISDKKRRLLTKPKHPESVFSDFLINPPQINLKNPMDSLPIAKNKDFGNYQQRREELIKKGEKWFEKMVHNFWFKRQWISEIEAPNISLEFAEGKSAEFNGVHLRFTKPLFHGIEFDRIGWVFGVIISYNRKKILYTSDIQGPFIEDYAKWIIDENPDLLIIDGPPTYLYGYLVNKTNLNRAKENIHWIMNSIKAEIIVYDHHLTRDSNYRDLFSEVYEDDPTHKLNTTAELYGLPPLILQLKNKL